MAEEKSVQLQPDDYYWAGYSDDMLLSLRFRDLGLRIENTELQPYIHEVYTELEARELTFMPQTYLADEWMTPDGDPVIGIPFFLAHPRLKKLEEKLCLDVEGGTKSSFKQLLRHEVGHAYNYAYLLHRKKQWKELFGPFSKKYSDTYIFRPYSKSFVRHLDDWYAQCHPDEDFAETFAVWLTPHLDWENKYRGWRALEKLRYVDMVMRQIRGTPPAVAKGEKYYAINRLTMRLQTYYRRKRKLSRQEYPDFHDSDLKRIFGGGAAADKVPASKVLREYRKSILDSVAAWSGGKKFHVNRLMQDLIERCDELDLHVSCSETESVLKVTAYITSLMMNYLVTGSFAKQ
jgi:hypothetical protein